MKDRNQQSRLQRFWGVTIFSLGIFWGLCNLIYLPIAALTSIVGSSWFEVLVIIAGGLLTFVASICAFYQRRYASRMLLTGGILLLLIAAIDQRFFPHETSGVINLVLLFISGIGATALGIFGEITERKGWPTLRRP